MSAGARTTTYATLPNYDANIQNVMQHLPTDTTGNNAMPVFNDGSLQVCLCVHARACTYVCVRACVCVGVCACVCVCV